MRYSWTSPISGKREVCYGWRAWACWAMFMVFLYLGLLSVAFVFALLWKSISLPVNAMLEFVL